MKDLETKYKQFEELEERYWQEFNSFQLQLTSNQVCLLQVMDIILVKIAMHRPSVVIHQNVLKPYMKCIDN